MYLFIIKMTKTYIEITFFSLLQKKKVNIAVKNKTQFKKNTHLKLKYVF